MELLYLVTGIASVVFTVAFVFFVFAVWDIARAHESIARSLRRMAGQDETDAQRDDAERE